VLRRPVEPAAITDIVTAFGDTEFRYHMVSPARQAVKLPRRKFLHLAAGATALPALSRVAKAQTYPTRSVHIISGFPAGSAADIVARLVGQPLSERIGQPIVTEDRPSAGSNLATEVVLRSPPDGYMLLMATVVNAINPTLYPDLNFNFVRDIAPVACIGGGDYVMVVTPSVSRQSNCTST
jgi:tripartite-type tricarboxylate transporter receptor subunit TctC